MGSAPRLHASGFNDLCPAVMTARVFVSFTKYPKLYP